MLNLVNKSKYIRKNSLVKSIFFNQIVIRSMFKSAISNLIKPDHTRAYATIAGKEKYTKFIIDIDKYNFNIHQQSYCDFDFVYDNPKQSRFFFDWYISYRF